MHDGVIWFDTAACFAGSHIGAANAVGFSSTRFGQKAGWWSDTSAAPTANRFDDYGRPLPDPRADAWDTDIEIITGSFKVSDKNLSKDFLKDLIELYEDCDIDC